MTVGRICCREVLLADPGENVLAVAGRMKQHNIGTLVVLDADRRPIGIVTDRDLVVRVLTEGRPTWKTSVEEVMTHHPHTVAEQSSIDDALVLMRKIGVRRMPVVGPEGELVGILSVDDVLELLAEELSDIGRVLARSARGVLPPMTRAE